MPKKPKAPPKPEKRALVTVYLLESTIARLESMKDSEDERAILGNNIDFVVDYYFNTPF